MHIVSYILSSFVFMITGYNHLCEAKFCVERLYRMKVNVITVDVCISLTYLLL